MVATQNMDSFSIAVEMKIPQNDTIQIFYDNGKKTYFDEQHSKKIDVKGSNEFQVIRVKIPYDKTGKFRLDLGDGRNKKVLIKEIRYGNALSREIFDADKIVKNFLAFNLTRYEITDNTINIEMDSNDPYIYSLSGLSAGADNPVDNKKIALYAILIWFIVIAAIFLLLRQRSIKSFITDIYSNRALITTLASNDFKTKYAGSYLGIVWAFIQPVMSILIYWFVFQVGFRAQTVSDVPFIIWLVTGMVPWFFFSDALINASNCFIEYSYLVKKVVFNIKILPFVKTTSSLIVHFFFLLIIACLFAIYGYSTGITFIQVGYFSVCTFCLALALSYIFAPIMIFFKDLMQIINIFLQFFMWLTPIMWNLSIVPEQYRWIFKLNPVYYITEGYRNSLLYHKWIWQSYGETIYFWAVTIVLFGIGMMIYKRLKPHFADVL
ncbi:ABC transporter permease [Gorillibacterium massiliense]|uniref:ABC transporter permease n=1 Tax=Gorillibacterium massiliense TaxID=1280390 RepID=UPI001EE39331|nr:ABC transporter permease [Gorillibacterium massiliense]